MAMAGRSIPVVRLLWEQIDRVRFPAARQNKTALLVSAVLFCLGLCRESNRGGGRGTAVGSPCRRVVENRGFSKNSADAEFCSLPGGPTTTIFKFSERWRCKGDACPTGLKLTVPQDRHLLCKR